jgi:hypothetical protein
MELIEHARHTFTNNVRSVQQLVDFDHTVLDSAIQNLGHLQAALDAKNPHVADRVGNTLSMLKNIREHDSMRMHYATIYNQCVVLLVSHFGSALHAMFIAAAPTLLGVAGEREALKEELKFSISELRELKFDLNEAIGNLLVAKRDIGFQDMQSTVRAFKSYLGIDIPRDQHMHNVIFAQAARHAIVHSGAVADARFVRQIAAADLRIVKPVIRERDCLAFLPNEVETVAASMGALIKHVERELLDSARQV